MTKENGLDRVSTVDAVLTWCGKVIPVLLARVHATVNGWVVIVIANVDWVQLSIAYLSTDV